MEPYQRLAAFYDTDWGSFTNLYVPFLKLLDQEFHLAGKKILDIACGTGNLALILAGMGCKVTGLDRSSAMLDIARVKCKNYSICFLVDKMQSFDLGDEQFDFIFNTFDSINYLLTLEEIKQFFTQVYQALKSDGYFIFDINTEHAFGYHHLGTFNREINGVRFIQKHSFDPQHCIETTCFLFDDGEEIHKQKGYPKVQIENLLAMVKFQIIACYRAFNLMPADENTERLLFLCSR
ncbi:class I SAM-dependent methyltransferase [candidate division KSB1 bacterium]|nr:class I SAM-dependent methyltransferase [candidate division KSB1 bacterium]